jgi:BolA protein
MSLPIDDELRQRLEANLRPTHLELHNDSARHAAHVAVGKHGGAHFQIVVVSPIFTNESLVNRHRMVYGAVGDLMDSRIHALSMKTLAPEEWQG